MITYSWIATQEAMKKQMVAERARRAEFIRSEGAKAAMRLRAEGTKIVSVNLGIAEQEATKKRSEGEATAKVEIARAEGIALETISAMVTSDGASQAGRDQPVIHRFNVFLEYMLSQKFIEFFQTVSYYVENKTIYLPYKLNGLSGIVKDLPQVYGAKASVRRFILITLFLTCLQ